MQSKCIKRCQLSEQNGDSVAQICSFWNFHSSLILINFHKRVNSSPMHLPDETKSMVV